VLRINVTAETSASLERSRYRLVRVRHRQTDRHRLERRRARLHLGTSNHAREGGGRNVEMTLERGFRRGPAGRSGSILNHLGGCRGWGFYLRRALKAVERASAAEPAGTR